MKVNGTEVPKYLWKNYKTKEYREAKFFSILIIIIQFLLAFGAFFLTFYIKDSIDAGYKGMDLRSAITLAFVMAITMLGMTFGIHYNVWRWVAFWENFKEKVRELETFLDKEGFFDFDSDAHCTEFKLKYITVQKMVGLGRIVTAAEVAERSAKEALKIASATKEPPKVVIDGLRADFKKMEEELQSATKAMREAFDLCAAFKLISREGGYSPFYPTT